jgi:predicted acetyltransferase
MFLPSKKTKVTLNFQLVLAPKSDKVILEQLLQFYQYDFSEYTHSDLEIDGQFKPYPYLDAYWTEPDQRFPYLIKQGEKYAGFVLVRFISAEKREYFSIAEFFILKKFRRSGLGKAVAQEVFDLYHGKWEVYQMENNQAAQAFWHNVIAAYTAGKFQERFEKGRRVQNFEN